MEVGFCSLTQPPSAFSVTLVFSDRPIARSRIKTDRPLLFQITDRLK
ncbi:MAG: hypothetical protein WBA89_03330 [Microcoleus sp.]